MLGVQSDVHEFCCQNFTHQRRSVGREVCKGVWWNLKWSKVGCGR